MTKAQWIAVLPARVAGACLAAAIGTCMAAPADSPTLATSAPFDLAVTVDDLPAHGALPPGMTRAGIAASHLATFEAHGVGEAFGFVNAAKLTEQAGSEAVLDLWRKAGHPLGNHTYSHMNLERAASLAAWQADVEAGESAVASRMANADWRYLRFPFLNAGGARQADGLAYLRARNYRTADVSLSFGDWVYTDAYARCMASGDTAAVAAMKARYLGDVDAAIVRMKADSLRVFGRIIPQVLLTHIGGWSAVTLPEVLARLDAAGARYVSLAQVQSDPAYALAGGGSVIERVARQRGIALDKEAAPGAATKSALEVKALCR